ncbi:hypothetical protein [Streptomyces apocyni]|uniref:hypothetical protein n=1 Tax=Streptomyces apocyni TaxID=2654677 RepID=UPI0012E9DCF1|nr:hypothetical protein [Streptomyces apocyni]
MPRPTAAQFSYGFATVISATLALLLLSHATSALGIAAIVCAALGLGLLASALVPAPKPAPAPRAATAATRVPVRRLHTGAESRVAEHSLRK